MKKNSKEVSKPKRQENFNIQENPVYIKLGYDESIKSKKNLLSSEMFLLEMMKIIKKYNSLRMNELDVKSQMNRAIRNLDESIRKTRAAFPFIKIPEKTKREEIVKIETPIRKEYFDENLESQLRSIQDKLKSIGS